MALPNFNLVANIWHNAVNYLINPPDLVTPCNLQYARKVHLAIRDPGGSNLGNAYLLVPALTDIRANPQAIAGVDFVEVPAGSGRYYEIIAVDDVSKGFAAEYRCGTLNQTLAYANWPVPMP